MSGISSSIPDGMGGPFRTQGCQQGRQGSTWAQRWGPKIFQPCATSAVPEPQYMVAQERLEKQQVEAKLYEPQ